MPQNLSSRILAILISFGFVCVSSSPPTPARAQPPTGFAWGIDGSGTLGDGLPLADQNFPVPLSDGAGGCCLDQLVDIQGADTHALALDSSQQIWTWGSSFVGQLGNGTTGSGAGSPVPVLVQGLSARIPTASAHEIIAAEGAHNLVIDSGGSVWSWGANSDGQLGVGPPGPATCGDPPPNSVPCSTMPVQVTLGNGNVVGVGAGARHSLAIVGDCAGGPADAYAWGDNSAGQLGDGTNVDRHTPVQVHGPLDMGFLSGVAKMVGGQGYTLALMCNGEVLAWGSNGSGQLGSGNTNPSDVPAPVVMQCAAPPRPLLGCPLTDIIDVAAGFEHSIAVDSMGGVWFWGSNTSGELCNGSNMDLTFATLVPLGAPALIAPPAGVPLDIVAGGANFSYVVTAQQSLVACGSGVVGQLGDCGNSDSNTPVSVLNGPSCSTPFGGVTLVEAGEGYGLMLAGAPPTPTPTPTHSPTPTPPCEDPISIDVSTGQNAVPGGNDFLWTLAALSQPSFPVPAPAVVISPSTAWTTLPNTQWISASTSCTLVCPAIDYEYELCWKQCGEFDFPETMMLLADDRATVFLDGTPVATTSSPGFTVPISFTFNPLPGPGFHRLHVTVSNDGAFATGMDFSGSLSGSVKVVPCGGTPSPTPTPSATVTRTSTPTATRSATPTETMTSTATPTSTVTSSPTPSRTATATPTECLPPPIDMVLWLSGDHHASDLSGNGNDAVLQGAAAYTVGQVADAFLISAHTDFLTVADDPTLNFTGNFSIDAWMRSTNGSTATIIDKRAGSTSNPVGYHFFLSAGNLGFQLGDGSPFSNRVAPGPPINDGLWHHVAVTVDRPSSTGGRLYVDGAPVLTFDPTTRPGSIANSASLRIGQRYLSNPQPFSGAIDEVEIFDRVLTAQEIQDVFNARAAGKCKPPPPTPILCVGDCDSNGQVTVDELIAGISIALGSAPLSTCPQFDLNDDGVITIDEIIVAVGNALNGCSLVRQMEAANRTLDG